MKYAKKIALKDLDREYRRVTRPAVPVRKSALSLDIRRILNNRKKNDDQKVKDYVYALHRYLNVGRQLPQLPTVHLPPPPPTPPPSPVLTPSPPPLEPPPAGVFDYLATSPDDRSQPKPKKKRRTISPAKKKKEHAKIKPKPKKGQTRNIQWSQRA